MRNPQKKWEAVVNDWDHKPVEFEADTLSELVAQFPEPDAISFIEIFQIGNPNQ